MRANNRLNRLSIYLMHFSKKLSEMKSFSIVALSLFRTSEKHSNKKRKDSIEE